MSHIKTQLLELVSHFESARQCGHTTAMLNGALSSRGCLVLAGNQESGEFIENLVGPAADIIVIGVPGLRDGRLRGLHKPLVIDNHAAAILFGDALREINRLESKLADIKRLAVSHAEAVKRSIES